MQGSKRCQVLCEMERRADRVALRCFLRPSLLNSIEYLLFDVLLSFIVELAVVNVVVAVAAGHRGPEFSELISAYRRGPARPHTLA